MIIASVASETIYENEVVAWEGVRKKGEGIRDFRKNQVKTSSFYTRFAIYT